MQALDVEARFDVRRRLQHAVVGGAQVELRQRPQGPEVSRAMGVKRELNINDLSQFFASPVFRGSGFRRAKEDGIDVIVRTDA